MAYTQQTWIDGESVANAARLNHMEDGIAAAVVQGDLVINAKDYGATGDGTTDDSAALTEALTAATGATLYIPEGTYNLGTSTLTPATDTRIIGAGRQTVLKCGGTPNGVNVNFVGGIKIESLTFDLEGGANQAIRLAGSFNTTVQDVRIFNGGTGTGVGVLSGSGYVTIQRLHVTGCNYAVLVNNGSTDTRIQDCVFLSGAASTSFEGHLYVPNGVRTTFINCLVDSAAGHGAWIGGATTTDVTLIGCAFNSCGTAGNDHRGVTVDSDCSRVKFIGCDFAENQEAGAYVSATPTAIDFIGCASRGNNVGLRPGGHGFEHLGTGGIASCRAEGTLGDAANEGCGIYVGGGASVADTDVVGNYSAGIRAVNANNVLISNNRARNNSQRGASLHDGIEITGLSAGASENISITGNRCWDDQATKTQRYGINVSSADVDQYIVTSNNTRGNATGGLNDAGGVNKSVANNL